MSLLLSVCVCFFFSWPTFLSSPLGPHHPTLHLNFSNCYRKRNCFLYFVVMLSRGLETSFTSSASSMLGEKTDEGLPKFGMPHFSKAWWREVFWVLEGSFFWQSVLASWPSCFSRLWPCRCLFPLLAVSYWSIPEHPTSLVWLLLMRLQRCTFQLWLESRAQARLRIKQLDFSLCDPGQIPQSPSFR